MKDVLKTAAIVAGTMFVIYRVDTLRELVTGRSF